MLQGADLGIFAQFACQKYSKIVHFIQIQSKYAIFEFKNQDFAHYLRPRSLKVLKMFKYPIKTAAITKYTLFPVTLVTKVS
jgi:hypothetical protein